MTDYPPNFRDPEVVRRHIAKCYPKINPVYFTAFMARVFPTLPTAPTPPSTTSAGSLVIDESESLVFWLSMTDSNAQFPFLTYMQPTTVTAPLPINAKRYYDFDETRLIETSLGATTVPMTTPLKSFRAKFCQDTYYVYLDSRSYDKPLRDQFDMGRFGPDNTIQNVSQVDTFAFTRGTPSFVRPYWSGAKDPNASPAAAPPANDPRYVRYAFKAVNATSFQLICAGQDGDFGFDPTDTDVKVFNNGLNYSEGDKDNITNFSGGSTLGDSIP